MRQANISEGLLKSPLGVKFIKCLMRNGKRTQAEKLLLKALSLLGKKPAFVLLKALENIRPLVELRTIRVRGANHQVPIPVSAKRSTCVAIKWIINSARKKRGASIVITLTSEIVSASKRQGEAYKKKLQIHQDAVKNRAYQHYRW